jgi:thioredoxin 1
MTLIEINETNFESEVLQSTVPVAVDFYGDYCAPCRMIKPALSLLAVELAGQAKILAVDVAANRKLASHYGISSVPTVLVIRNGNEVHRMVGIGALAELRDVLAW